MSLRDEIIAALSVPGNQLEAKDVFDPASDEGKRIQTMTDFVTSGVDFLRSQFPNPAINRLMSLAWDLIGNRVTPVAFGPAVPTLAITVVGHRENPLDRKAIIIAPRNWLALIEKDHIMEMGALVFVGSQAADFYCKHLEGQEDAAAGRAHAYEAEYLLTIASMTTDWKPTEYQTRVMKEYPNGLGDVSHLTYEYRKYVNAPVLSHGDGHWAQLRRTRQ